MEVHSIVKTDRSPKLVQSNSAYAVVLTAVMLKSYILLDHDFHYVLVTTTHAESKDQAIAAASLDVRVRHSEKTPAYIQLLHSFLRSLAHLTPPLIFASASSYRSQFSNYLLSTSGCTSLTVLYLPNSCFTETCLIAGSRSFLVNVIHIRGKSLPGSGLRYWTGKSESDF